MKMKLVLMSMLAVVLAAVPAIAQEEEVALPEGSASYEFAQGTITSVSPAHDLIQVEEANGGLTAFEVPLETPISYSGPEEAFVPPTRDALEVGQQVEVGFYSPEGPEILIYPSQRTADQITIFDPRQT